MANEKTSWLEPADLFADRHIGPRDADVAKMLEALGVDSLEALIEEAVPAAIRTSRPLLGAALSERELLERVREIAEENDVRRNFIGMGYHGCITPPVIQRNILEDPGWYTQYTPYQAEIAQGRLEALLNFQTMVCDLTGLELANSSLLDEGTAAAEAMAMCFDAARRKRRCFLVADNCHPQTIDIVRTRAEPIGVDVIVSDIEDFELTGDVFGILLQYPDTRGRIVDFESLCAQAKEVGAMSVVATDLLALTLLRPPGEFGADVAVGNSQRFGVPMGYGGPHAAFFATNEVHRRRLPGRIVGISQDSQGGSALRLALQTREQHIRRERATSNICTSQVLLAIVASMYGVYHGPARLKAIATRVLGHTQALALGLERLGVDTGEGPFFDTLNIELDEKSRADVLKRALAARINLRQDNQTSLGISLDETKGGDDVMDLLALFAGDQGVGFGFEELASEVSAEVEVPFARCSDYMTHPVFNSHHSETELLRYMTMLRSRDLSLAHSMIPLGSCTMKLNATAEMMPVTWPEFGGIHPFAPLDQARGYKVLMDELSAALVDMTGFAGASLQPNAGSQGEYTGLLVIRAYHRSRGEHHRNICLIPSSAHGTNPASAVMAGLKVVTIKCDDEGNIDLEDLRAKSLKHADKLSALMVTYPSTHGVFEEEIKGICEVVHGHGGQVYLDGANLNALVGLCRVGEIGADVCHLNLHKTLCIPHGGGGPGMGPIAVARHLTPFLPGHGVVPGVGGEQAIGAVSAAPWGSPSILPISWAYIRMMGADGLLRATMTAILNANYVAARLAPHYPVLYKGIRGRVAHECILDLRPLKRSSGVSVADVAKRLMDFGFHAPTISWPVAGTMMIEPTESESKVELDRFCDAMIAIRQEVTEIEEGRWSPDENPLKGAPHTAEMVGADSWDRAYSRTRAAFPAPWVKANKFWPTVGRVDDAFGDRNLVCSCPPMEAYEDPQAGE
jgi:glycine dehydrogenase